jgi:thermospermine synthase
MVDIDGEVVSACRQYLPHYSDGAFDHYRSTLVIDDGEKVVRMLPENSLDVLILDLNDPMAGGPCAFYTKEFYEIAAARLRPTGILVTQAGEVGESEFCVTFNTLAAVFGTENCFPYGVYTSSFGDETGFCMAFKKHTSIPPNFCDGAFVDSITPALYLARGTAAFESMKWYDTAAHKKMFCITKPIRRALDSCNQISTTACPFVLDSDFNRGIFQDQDQDQDQAEEKSYV